MLLSILFCSFNYLIYTNFSTLASIPFKLEPFIIKYTTNLLVDNCPNSYYTRYK